MVRPFLCTILCMALFVSPVPSMAERQQIGGAPQNHDATLPIAGVDWQSVDGRVSIALQRQDGRSVDIGTFPSAVVFPALMFAADGRPYVVSLEAAPPLYDRKVLLHPVLQDTALGCRLLQIDRLAGTLRQRDPMLAAEIDKAERALVGQVALYELTWAIRVMAALDAIQKDEFGASTLLKTQGWNSVRQSLSYAKHLAEAGSSHIEPYWQDIAARRKDGDPLDLLRAKADYFHRDVTQVADQCLTAVEDVSAFQGCVQQQSVAGLFEMLDNSDLIWGAPPPRWDIAYGIGEIGYDLEENLNAITSAHPDPRTTFVAWVNFLSLPNFLENTGAPWFSVGNTAILNYRDTNPFVLDALEAPLVQSANTLFDSGPYWQTSRETLESFTLLQRLFRLGFDERFGPEFPIEQFTALGEKTATAAFSENYRTPRWLAKPGALERETFFIAKDLGLAPDLGKYDLLGKRAEACANLISGVGAGEVTMISSAEWANTCDPEPLMSQFAVLKGRPDNLDEIGFFVQRQVLSMIRLSYARKIRKELDVVRDDGFDLSGEVCPVP